MKEPKLKFWHPIIGFIIIGAIDTLNWGLNLPVSTKFLIADLIDWASGICLLLLLYIIVRNIIRAVKGLIARRSSEETEELERQREAERREVEIVRKSNEILLHLIQDEHREEEDR
ncbi:hypothetical protein [uncultured Oscillibacter sp.]|uniref:hypothetical protein n=1 Tax=uncultured Oscillibacter sp. TaxID=876091 RepID=UPI0025E08D31|nr:hypothetical protein [uncultured Oscillibacter sp.]